MINLSRIKEALTSLLIECGSANTDKGTLEYDGEELIKGATTTAADGEYVLDDGTVVTVKDGTISDIKETEPTEETSGDTETPTEETEPTEEPKEEETHDEMPSPSDVGTEITEPEPNTPSEIETMKAEIENLKGEIMAIKAQIAELNQPVVDPITEQFKAQKENEIVEENKWSRMASAFKSNKNN